MFRKWVVIFGGCLLSTLWGYEEAKIGVCLVGDYMPHITRFLEQSKERFCADDQTEFFLIIPNRGVAQYIDKYKNARKLHVEAFHTSPWLFPYYKYGIIDCYRAEFEKYDYLFIVDPELCLTRSLDREICRKKVVACKNADQTQMLPYFFGGPTEQVLELCHRMYEGLDEALQTKRVLKHHDEIHIFTACCRQMKIYDKLHPNFLVADREHYRRARRQNSIEYDTKLIYARRV